MKEISGDLEEVRGEVSREVNREVWWEVEREVTQLIENKGE